MDGMHVTKDLREEANDINISCWRKSVTIFQQSDKASWSQEHDNQVSDGH